MNVNDLIKLSAKKAVQEISWESIEFLFKPSNTLELLLRIDFDGMSKKITDFLIDESPDAIPFRFRRKQSPELIRAIELEKFYMEMLDERNKL